MNTAALKDHQTDSRKFLLPLHSTTCSIEVCLVSMPYAAIQRPSLALSLLKQILEDAGLKTLVLYPNLWFAEMVGLGLYHLCSSQLSTSLLAGEWTFSAAAFPEMSRNDDEYLRCVSKTHGRVEGYKQEGGDRKLIADLQFLRRAASQFIDQAAHQVIKTETRIVACSSTFEQHVPSLALLRRIKELAPDIITMIGGANCETTMGEATHRNFPWVDYVMSGEGDGIIAPLCRDALHWGQEIPPQRLPVGVMAPCHRQESEEAEHPLSRALFHDLNATPIPDFQDYFKAIEPLALSDAIVPGLLLETSRGCWWGAVHHCTFCGLNGSSMGYRSKAPDRVLKEIQELEHRYGVSNFEVVDNILDMAYLRSVLPRLGEGGGKRRFFYEVKANLTRQQMQVLRQSGIIWIQPGIESLHTAVLKIMDKGIKGWQNIQLLKWAREFGIRVSWSILWGFPGEEEAWYQQMATWVPLLEHLQPPAAPLIRLRYDRYSVYHTQAEALGLKLWPISAMRFVYPLTVEQLADLSYFFIEDKDPDLFSIVGEYFNPLEDRPNVAELTKAALSWKKSFWGTLPPILSMEDYDGVLEIIDTRKCATLHRSRFTGLYRAVILACDAAPLESRLPEVLARDYELRPTASQLSAVLEDLRQRGLLLFMDKRILSLAVQGNLPDLPSKKDFPGGHVQESALRKPRTWTIFREVT